jgi:2-phosphosulfolactate phosphatase
MNNIYTILTPELFSLYSDAVVQKQLVVIDVLRATTSMVVMLENGAERVVPLASIEEARVLGEKGYLMAGERNGFKVDGFDFGNSPQEFTRDAVGGNSVVMTTTNGTHALSLCQQAKIVYVGAFLNCTVTCDALMKEEGDIYLFCSGWKGFFNLEDTLLAGAMASSLCLLGATIADDATRAALHLWNQAKTDVAGFLSDANHVQRFQSMHAESDLDVCLRIDTSKKVVYYVGGELVTERL